MPRRVATPESPPASSLQPRLERAIRVLRRSAVLGPPPVVRDHVAFYAGRMDACTVDGELAVPQPGGFYGSWIRSDVVGPFTGGPGTMRC